MRKIKRIVSIALILVLIGVVACKGIVYAGNASLRVPFHSQEKGFEVAFRKAQLIKEAELAGAKSTREEVKTAFQRLGAMSLHGYIIIDPEGRNWLILGKEASGKAALAGKLFEDPTSYGQWDLLANVEVMAFFDTDNPSILIGGQSNLIAEKKEKLVFLSDEPRYVITDRSPKTYYGAIDGIIIMDSKVDLHLMGSEHILSDAEKTYDFLKEVLKLTIELPEYMGYREGIIEPEPDKIAQYLSASRIPLILVQRPFITPAAEFNRMVKHIYELTRSVHYTDQSPASGEGVEKIQELLTKVKTFLLNEWEPVSDFLSQERDPSEILSTLESFRKIISEAEKMLPETTRPILRDGLQEFFPLEPLARVQNLSSIEQHSLAQVTKVISSIDKSDAGLGKRLMLDLQDPGIIRRILSDQAKSIAPNNQL